MLIHAFTGYVDAGGAVRMTIDHLLEHCEHELIASFDVDAVMDYRARRPVLSYSVDHFTGVDIPTIQLHEVTDTNGASFLLLAGPEPDYQWMRFIAAVSGLGHRLGIRLAVAVSGIPWPAPHTRPLGITVHGSDPELVRGFRSVVGEVDVPGHMGAMLEYHLAQDGFDSMGITAQVPFPRGALPALRGCALRVCPRPAYGRKAPLPPLEWPQPRPDRAMNLYDRYVMPLLIDACCGMKDIQKQRALLIPRARGRVLEIGIGTGRNLGFYDASKLESLQGLDPADQMNPKAEQRARAAGLKVELLTLSAEEIPAPDATYDTVVCTFTLCTIPDPIKALREMRRVLKPGGKLL
ncbi:MAG: PAC2 family protein, partial [Actinomycetota bacterium]|nr:PAC2 family protein [Actinomycetota bacterium]